MKNRIRVLGTVLREIAAGALWFPVVVYGAHVIASRVLLAYDYFPQLDIPMHLAGGIAIAFFFLRSLNALEVHGLIQDPGLLVTLTLLFTLTCTAAVFWEFAEYVTDHTLGTRAQLGLEDTLLDMLFGILGGAAFIAVRAWQKR